MYILGISAYYHDSSVTLLKDGKMLFALEEERLSRKKHDNSFPYKALKLSLKLHNLKPEDIKYIAYYEKPLLKFERILETFVESYPFSIGPFVKGIPEWLGYKLKIENTIRKLGFKKAKIFYIPHHLSHASASYFTSPFKTAAILTLDGVGDKPTTGLWKAENGKIIPLKLINFPHSLGLLYSTFTAFLGFRVNFDEYKMMGLSAYGKPRYKDKIYKIIHVNPDGSFKLNLNYFSFRESFSPFNQNFINLFGPPKTPSELFTQRHKDISASIQRVLEEIYLKILNHFYKLTKTENLCVGGGVALNSLANGKIYDGTPFKKVYIFGTAGDSGTSAGAALFLYHKLTSAKKTTIPIKTLYLGTFYSNDEIEHYLKKYKLAYIKFKSKKELVKKTAKQLAKGKIVGWFQGKMEFGPRALGSRSILANPKERKMKALVNRIKLREQFRPFAGSILQEKVDEYFEVPEKNHWSPFMVFCFRAKKEKQKEISAIVHKDGTCRIQTVNKDNGIYYELIKEFYKLTGIPGILNTSFNLKGEPIVEHPTQAIEDFLKTKMDYLVIGDFVVSKS